MRLYLAVPAYICLTTLFAGCSTLSLPETQTLQCGETKNTQYNIPTKRGKIPVDVQFKMVCNANEKGLVISIKNHPWGGVGQTMAQSVGEKAPNYEYIPCGGNEESDAILESKWDDFRSFEHFANRGRGIEDIQHVDVGMRFLQDYALRSYMLNSAKNMCLAMSQRDMK